MNFQGIHNPATDVDDLDGRGAAPSGGVFPPGRVKCCHDGRGPLPLRRDRPKCPEHWPRRPVVAPVPLPAPHRPRHV